MAKIIPIFIFLFVAMGCKSSVPKADTIDKGKTPLDLFYGMSDWYDHKETYTDSILDNIPGLYHQEFRAVLSIPEDSVRYLNSLGVYVDEDYPSIAVRKNVLSHLDSLICLGISYDIEDDLSHDLSKIESTEEFLDVWKDFYDNLKEKADSENQHSSFREIPGTRVCVVSHKVASGNDRATYLMESSYDYHGSSGCPGEADYITYNISSGKPLSIDEVLKLYPVSNLEDKLRKAYIEAAKKNNFEPLESMTGQQLLQDADGAAIINEGLLIYYKPYKIGSGAEGQYNLILK